MNKEIKVYLTDEAKETYKKDFILLNYDEEINKRLEHEIRGENTIIGEYKGKCGTIICDLEVLNFEVLNND